MDLLDIKTQEELIGISYVNTDKYCSIDDKYREVLKKRRYPKQDNLFKKWGYTEIKYNKETATESYCILREVDEELFYNLYGQLFNPVVINIDAKKENFSVQFLIDSIDDSAFCYWFEDKAKEEVDSLRDKIVEWVESNPVIIKSNIVKFLEELGGIDESW